MNFEEMGLSPQIKKALQEMGFVSPTPIQEQAIPLLMQGEDLIGQAQTGTGKTAAFGLPALEYCIKDKLAHGQETTSAHGIDHSQSPKQFHSHPDHRRGVAAPSVLVLAPTRELAVQIAEEMKKMGKFCHANIVCVYGGQEMEKQLRAFERQVDIVVGTPGRVLDHIERTTLRLDLVKFVVLDEADRMLDMGFIDDVVKIMNKTNPQRQIALFSATMPREIENVGHEYMKSPQKVKVSEDNISVDKIVQKYVRVEGSNKVGFLLAILKEEHPKLALIFARTKMGAEKLCGILQRKGMMADSLHGDMRQGARDRVMREFKEGKLHVLVATDLASRGLDVFEISHVINYDLPEEPLTYVHRIGRTGRMGAEGMAISLVFPDQMEWIENLPKVTNVPVHEMKITPLQAPPHSPRQFGEREHSHHEGGMHGRGYSSSRHEHSGGGYGRSGSGYGHSGGRGGSPGRASGLTMKKISQRARKPAQTHMHIRGGHYSGRQR